MSEKSAFERISTLITQIKAVQSQLAPNEQRLFAELCKKYKQEMPPGGPGFEDEACLQVILRNVGIRDQLRKN